MNIILASESFIVRDALKLILQELIDNPKILTILDLNKKDMNQIIDLDFIFTDIKDNWQKQMEIIKEAKATFENLKVLVLDRKNNRIIFEEAVKLGIEGYIIGFTERDEFIFILKKVLEGKKVYESELIQRVLNSNQNQNIHELTKREREVLLELGKGINNKQISENLHVTEYTIKKHVSSILDKLNLKNRQEAILYLIDNPF